VLTSGKLIIYDILKEQEDCLILTQEPLSIQFLASKNEVLILFKDGIEFRDLSTFENVGSFPIERHEYLKSIETNLGHLFIGFNNNIQNIGSKLR